MQTKIDILVIDDEQLVLRSIGMLLRAKRSQCLLLLGVESSLVATNGSLCGLNQTMEPCPIDLSTIAVAFVDGNMPVPGWQIVPCLKEAGVPWVVATSATHGQLLMKAGADWDCGKDNLSAYIGGRFAADVGLAREKLAASKKP